MTELEINERNLVYALKYGFIDWFKYFELYKKLHGV